VLLSTEIKRKLFHHLSLVYMAIYAFTPGWFAIGFLGLVLLMFSALEFIRLRRPEVNDWFLKIFGGLHRPTEILAPSGIFWTLGHFTGELRYISSKMGGVAAIMTKPLLWIIPDMSLLNLRDSFAAAVPHAPWSVMLGYSTLYCGVSLALACLLFSRKEF